MKYFLGSIVASSLLGFGPAATAEEKSPYEYFDILTASSPSSSRSKEWKPGDGIALEVGGMAWIGPDRLAVAIRKGEVWLIDGVLSDDRDDVSYRLFASGLHEPLGLLEDGDDLLVTQRSEVTRLQDRDGDGAADAYLTEASGWNVSGNYHAYAYGPERDGAGNLWVTLNLGMGDLADNAMGWRGWGGWIDDDGQFVPKALGMRSPSGLGTNRQGDVFFSDQQGTWIPATPIHHLRPGVFYGNQESLDSLELPEAPFRMSSIPPANTPYPEALESSPEFVPPAVWLPYNKVGRSATDLQLIDMDGQFGPFDGQFLVGEFTNAAISRVFLEKVGGEYQGACFPLLDGFPSAVFRLAFAPDGSLFVGMTNRGWSSLGNRSYGLTRVRFAGEPVFAIREMRAMPDGFELRFTEPVDPASVSAEGAFAMSSYTYEYAARYGGEEIDTKARKITDVQLSDDGVSVRLRVEGLRPFYVHELRTSGLESKGGRSLDHPDAYYTLNRIPQK
ncbi:MAG: hypothetical protein WD342_13010 [Verrucomicrobiales bacterium]